MLIVTHTTVQKYLKDKVKVSPTSPSPSVPTADVNLSKMFYIHPTYSCVCVSVGLCVSNVF